MSGETVVGLSDLTDYTSPPRRESKAVADLEVGDVIDGLDKDMKRAACKIEAVGFFGKGVVYSNYTKDHFVLDAREKLVLPNGDGGAEYFADKYAVLTSCPVGIDESGVGFTAVDSDFLGAEALSWSDYVVVHKGILDIVRKAGPFPFFQSTYTSMADVSEYSYVLYETMLKCAKNEQDSEACELFEKAAVNLVENAMTDEAKEKVKSSFPDLGDPTSPGSVAALVSGRPTPPPAIARPTQAPTTAGPTQCGHDLIEVIVSIGVSREIITDKQAELLLGLTGTTPPPTIAAPTPPPTPCEDDSGWLRHNGKHTCFHVGKGDTVARCVWKDKDGIPASAACKKTCGTCGPPAPEPTPGPTTPEPTRSMAPTPCEDDLGWRRNVNDKQTCLTVKQKATEVRCEKWKDKDGIPASAACKKTCGTCGPPAPSRSRRLQSSCGWFDIGTVPGSPGNNHIRITGYGTAAVASRSQKTHMDDLVQVGGTFLRYIPDTTGGNSGSPVIREETCEAIGVHTHGGCESGGNQGTRIDRADFAAHINFLLRSCTTNSQCPGGVCQAGRCHLTGPGCPSAPPTPPPTPAPVSNPSCMAGGTMVGHSRERPKPVRTLEVGQAINGLDKGFEPADCKVEAVGFFGRGPVYGNYTEDHFILDDEKKVVRPNGKVWEGDTVDKFAVLTSCPVGLDETGIGFTAVDADFLGRDAFVWEDYVLVHTGIVELVRATGNFVFTPEAYTSMAEVRKYTKVFRETMLKCMQDCDSCYQFEDAAVRMVENSLAAEAKEKVKASLPDLGKATGRRSATAAVTKGKCVKG